MFFVQISVFHCALARALKRKVLFAVLVCCIGAVCSAQDNFEIIPVGVLEDEDPKIPTPPASSGNAINETGVVAGGSAISGGSISVPGDDKDDPVAIFAELIRARPILRQLDGSISKLTVPVEDDPSRASAVAWGLNEQQWIVGSGSLDTDTKFHVFVWVPASTPDLPFVRHELPGLNPTESVLAHSINNRGTVAGESGTLLRRAVVWTLDQPGLAAWTINDLGFDGSANDINDSDQVTGVMQTQAGATTFLHLAEPAFGFGTGTHDVTPLISNDFGRGINSAGQIAGGAGVSPMVFLPEPAFGLETGVHQLSIENLACQQTLDLLDAAAFEFAFFEEINDSGTAVGKARYRFETVVDGPLGEITILTRGFRAIVTEPGLGTPFLLRQLVPDSGWGFLSSAEDINNAGWITGLGSDPDANFTGFIVRPTQVLLGDVNGDGDVNLLDVAPFVNLILTGTFQAEGDVNGDGAVDLLDVAPFVVLLTQ